MKKSLLIVYLLMGLSLQIVYSQTNKLVFTSPGPGHPMYDVAKRVLPEAAKSIGYEIEFKDMPPSRATVMFDNGEVDGYLFADDTFLKFHAGAVKVMTPLGYDEFFVMTKKLDFKPDGWASLKPYRIGYMVGMTIVENNIRGMKTDSSQSPPQAFDKLMADRTDVVVFPLFLYEAFKGKYPEMKKLEPSIEKVALYTFVTSKRADVAVKLADAIGVMRKNGRIKTITDEVSAGLR